MAISGPNPKVSSYVRLARILRLHSHEQNNNNINKQQLKTYLTKSQQTCSITVAAGVDPQLLATARHMTRLYLCMHSYSRAHLPASSCMQLKEQAPLGTLHHDRDLGERGGVELFERLKCGDLRNGRVRGLRPHTKPRPIDLQ